MQQIKLFVGLEDQLTALENEVNAWIKQAGVSVISIQANIAPQTLSKEGSTQAGPGRNFRTSDILVLVVYQHPVD